MYIKQVRYIIQNSKLCCTHTHAHKTATASNQFSIINLASVRFIATTHPTTYLNAVLFTPIRS